MQPNSAEQGLKTGASIETGRRHAMKLLRISQTIWAAGWAAYAILVLVWSNYATAAVVLCGVAAVYLVAAIGTFRDKRWAWALALAILGIVWLRYALKLALNIHEAAFGSLYQDSPGTYFVLAIELVPTL